jgi:hypothetical protein
MPSPILISIFYRRDTKYKQERKKGHCSPKNCKRRKLIESSNGQKIQISNPMELNEKILWQEGNQSIFAGSDLIASEFILVIGSPRIINVDEPSIFFPQHTFIKLHTFPAAPPFRLAQVTRIP